MEKSLLIEFLGDAPFIRVVDFLIGNSIFDYTKTDIADNAEISRASLYKIWPLLEKYQLIKESRKIGNTTLYKLNKENPLVQELISLDLKLSMEFVDKVEEKEIVIAKASSYSK